MPNHATSHHAVTAERSQSCHKRQQLTRRSACCCDEALCGIQASDISCNSPTSRQRPTTAEQQLEGSRARATTLTRHWRADDDGRCKRACKAQGNRYESVWLLIVVKRTNPRRAGSSSGGSWGFISLDRENNASVPLAVRHAPYTD
jgi:hypothetical protein